MRYAPLFLNAVFFFVTTISIAAADYPGAKPCSIEAQERPFVLLSRGRLEQLRADAKPGAPLHALYVAAVKQNADRWLSREIVIPERSGHYHHFTCTDGTRLPEPADQQFPPVTSGTLHVFECPACGKTYSDEKVEGAMRQRQHTWLMGACRDLALAGAIEQRNDYTTKAAEILIKYADAYPGRHTGATTGGIYYQSLDESVHFITLAQAYDLIYDANVLTDADKEHIERDLLWEAAEGFIKVGIGGNWGSWHLSGVGAIGLATKHQRYIDHGVNSFKSQIKSQLGDDGLWPESVHTYHFYPMRAFLHLAEGCANAGIDLYNWEAKPGKSLLSMFTAPLSYMYPNFQLAAINDGWFASFLPLDVYEIGYERYKVPGFAWVVNELRRRGDATKTSSPDTVDIWSLIHAVDPPEAPSPKFQPTNFPVIGIATLRMPSAATGKETMLTFDYGRNLGHSQADNMGVTIFAEDKLIAADYGTPSYGSAILPYYKGTISHNTVMMNGKNHSGLKEHHLLCHEVGKQLQLVCAETTEALPGVTWRRAVALTPDYILIVDQLRGETPHQFDWLFHAEAAELKFDGESTSALEELKLPFTENARAWPSQNKIAAQWQPAAGWPSLALASATSTEAKVFTAQVPAESAVRKVPLIVIRQNGSNVAYATLMKIGGDQTTVSQPILKTTDTGLTATFGSGETAVTMSFEAEKVTASRGSEKLSSSN